MLRSVAINFDGKEGGVKLDPTREVEPYLAEMQVAVVNAATRLGAKANINPLQGTLLVEKLKTGLLFDSPAVKSAADAAALRTAFYMDQQEQNLGGQRGDKIVNFSLKPELSGNRSFILRGNFRFRDGNASEFRASI